MNEVTQGILLLSNKYTQICDLYKCYCNDNDNFIMSYDTAKNIVDIIINNAKMNQTTPTFYLIGGDSVFSWTIITKKIIEYINSQDIYSKIILQIEEDIRELDDFHNFLKLYNNISLYVLYNSLVTTPFIQELLMMKPFLKIIYKININNYSSIFNDFIKLNQLHVKKIKYIYDLSQMEETTFNIDDIYNEFIQIQNFIINSFNNNTVPLIPDNINNNFIKVMMQNEIEKRQKTEQIRIDFFHYAELMAYHCNMILGKKLIFNPLGEIYLCSKDKLNKENSFYCGDLNSHISSDEIFEKIFNKKKELYNTLEPYPSDLRCKSCSIYPICNIDCFGNNLCFSSNSLFPNRFYCGLINKWNEITITIIKNLDSSHNELFKNYFYIYCQKGINENE